MPNNSETDLVRLEVGVYIRDRELNLYRVIDEAVPNGHSGKPQRFQVECLKGPNTGKVRWVGRNVVLSGDFELSEKETNNAE